MNVLVLLDSANPYPSEICAYLNSNHQCNIDSDIHKFWLPDLFTFDVIHFHWPEVVLSKINSTTPYQYDKHIKSELYLLSEVLKKWKAKAKIVTTIHNLKNHTSNSHFNQTAFKTIISFSDYFIHLGQESVIACSQLFAPHIHQKNSSVIPHNMYEYYPNTTTQLEARKTLKLSNNDYVILVFGDVRTKDEIDFVFDTFKKVSAKNKRLLIARWKFEQHLGRLHQFKTLFSFWLRAIKIGVINRFIRTEEVQLFFNAADIVFCPRNNSLNSGVIPLSASFKKPVVGPSVGNMREQLLSSGQKTFSPFDSGEAARAIDEMGFENLKEKGLNFHTFGKNNWSIQQVAEQHFEVYKKLLFK